MPGRMRDPGPAAGRALAAGTPGPTWTVAELRARAAELGVIGRSRMTKDELISALRREVPGRG